PARPPRGRARRRRAAATNPVPRSDRRGAGRRRAVSWTGLLFGRIGLCRVRRRRRPRVELDAVGPSGDGAPVHLVALQDAIDDLAAGVIEGRARRIVLARQVRELARRPPLAEPLQLAPERPPRVGDLLPACRQRSTLGPVPLAGPRRVRLPG